MKTNIVSEQSSIAILLTGLIGSLSHGPQTQHGRRNGHFVAGTKRRCGQVKAAP